MPASLCKRAGTMRAEALRYLNHFSDFRLTPPPMMINSGELMRSATARKTFTRSAHSRQPKSRRFLTAAEAKRSMGFPFHGMWPN